MLISSLFSMFDPCSSSWGVMGVGKWIFICCPFLLLNWAVFIRPLGVGGVSSVVVINGVNVFLLQYFNNSETSSAMLILVTIFIGIFWWNETGLVPCGFGVTSQLVINLSLGLVIFAAGVFVVLKNSGVNSLLAHIVPEGAPLSLCFALVFVESVSFLIRPFTLSVRLVGNIVTGHLLVALLCELIQIILLLFPSVGVVVMFLGCGLLAFEVIVSLVQSAIFTTLLIIYWAE